jgi:hypothetical protein
VSAAENDDDGWPAAWWKYCSGDQVARCSPLPSLGSWRLPSVRVLLKHPEWAVVGLCLLPVGLL